MWHKFKRFVIYVDRRLATVLTKAKCRLAIIPELDPTLRAGETASTSAADDPSKSSKKIKTETLKVRMMMIWK